MQNRHRQIENGDDKKQAVERQVQLEHWHVIEAVWMDIQQIVEDECSNARAGKGAQEGYDAKYKGHHVHALLVSSCRGDSNSPRHDEEESSPDAGPQVEKGHFDPNDDSVEHNGKNAAHDVHNSGKICASHVGCRLMSSASRNLVRVCLKRDKEETGLEHDKLLF